MSQYDKLKELALAATPGPWYDDSEWSPDDVSIWAGKPGLADFLGNVGGDRLVEVGVAFDLDANNGKYLAAANPATILALIAQRDELLAALRATREACKMVLSERHRLSDGTSDAVVSGIYMADQAIANAVQP